MEEQSAMQRLVKQLKDARESMLTAKDDMNYWKVNAQTDRQRSLFSVSVALFRSNMSFSVWRS
jgi:hypothetical protein